MCWRYKKIQTFPLKFLLPYWKIWGKGMSPLPCAPRIDEDVENLQVKGIFKHHFKRGADFGSPSMGSPPE